MKATHAELIRIDADDGKWIDWKEPRFNIDEDGNEVRDYLKAKTIYLAYGDSTSNYVEMDADGNITELGEIEFAIQGDYEAALAELGVE